MPIDASASVASTARVHANAVIGPGTQVGEYCVIESDVVIGRGCRFEPYVYVKRWTTMGDHNEVSAGAALGTDPLDKAFTGERSYLIMGNGNKVREHFTISRGTKPESETRIGDENYIMTGGHIAHNCLLGNRIVVASGTLLAGYVEVEDQAFISGNTAVHQFSRIGTLAMVAGLVRVNSDLPPYFLYGGTGFTVLAKGLNIVGLRRAGFSREQIQNLKSAYKLLYRSGLKLSDALQRIESELPGALTDHLVEFIRKCKRRIAREDSDDSDDVDQD